MCIEYRTFFFLVNIPNKQERKRLPLDWTIDCIVLPEDCLILVELVGCNGDGDGECVLCIAWVEADHFNGGGPVCICWGQCVLQACRKWWNEPEGYCSLSLPFRIGFYCSSRFCSWKVLVCHFHHPCYIVFYSISSRSLSSKKAINVAKS